MNVNRDEPKMRLFVEAEMVAGGGGKISGKAAKPSPGTFHSPVFAAKRDGCSGDERCDCWLRPQASGDFGLIHSRHIAQYLCRIDAESGYLVSRP